MITNFALSFLSLFHFFFFCQVSALVRCPSPVPFLSLNWRHWFTNIVSSFLQTRNINTYLKQRATGSTNVSNWLFIKRHYGNFLYSLVRSGRVLGLLPLSLHNWWRLCRFLLRLSQRLFLCTLTSRRETLATLKLFFLCEDFPRGCLTVIIASFLFLPPFLFHPSYVSLAL